MFMMTSAVALFAERRCRRLYLGTCYSQNALYKTQFAGAEFFNGFRWSDDLAELKFILRRDAGELSEHLLEAEDYRRLFHDGSLDEIVRRQPLPPHPRLTPTFSHPRPNPGMLSVAQATRLSRSATRRPDHHPLASRRRNPPPKPPQHFSPAPNPVVG